MPSTLGDATAVAAQHLDDAHPVCRRIRLFMLNTGDCVSCELDEGHDGDCLCHGATGWWRFPQPTPKRGYTTGNVTAVDAADVPAEAASRVVGRIIYWSVPT